MTYITDHQIYRTGQKAL